MVPQVIKVHTPDRVTSAENRTPAPEPTARKAMHAARLLKRRAGQGTPRESTLLSHLGALFVRAINRIVREATYREELPAEMTEITIRALMRWAAEVRPASSRAIVSGDRAARGASAARSRGSFHGIKMPMKNIMPLDVVQLSSSLRGLLETYT